MAEDKKKEEFAVIDITEEYLKERIYEIRGQRVILDADLSEIYGYTTKAFNQQVKNNIEKFDEDFMFELTDDEVENLRSNFLTANLNSKSRYNPYVFTLVKALQLRNELADMELQSVYFRGCYDGGGYLKKAEIL